ncbi:MAG: hypothetical protein AB7T14_02130 [Candidatus Methylacidiphilaceae bacterium]
MISRDTERIHRAQPIALMKTKGSAYKQSFSALGPLSPTSWDRCDAQARTRSCTPGQIF